MPIGVCPTFATTSHIGDHDTAELAIAYLAKVRFGPRDASLQTGFHGIRRVLGIEPKPVGKVSLELSQDVGRNVHAFPVSKARIVVRGYRSRVRTPPLA